jgi:transcription elongation factor GreB
VTPEGHARLEAELERIWKVERPKVTHEVAEAAALGDRSENAEYIYGKRRLREIDRRIRYLVRLLEKLIVVSEVPDDRERVFFGAWVTVEDEAGRSATWRLVGPDETELEAGRISIASPMARALLGKRVGDDASYAARRATRGADPRGPLLARFPPLAFGAQRSARGSGFTAISSRARLRLAARRAERACRRRMRRSMRRPASGRGATRGARGSTGEGRRASASASGARYHGKSASGGAVGSNQPTRRVSSLGRGSPPSARQRQTRATCGRKPLRT